MSVIGPAGAPGSLRARTYHVIFTSEAGWARSFDIFLMLAIVGSVVAVMLDSVAGFRAEYGAQLRVVEWIFTVLFTVEYALRLWCVRRSRDYAFSFFGIIDVLAVIPTYVSVLLPGGHYLTVIRILRVIRVFRVLKLAQYVGEARVLMTALAASRHKISVFLVAVVTIVVVVGSLMYIVEGPANGFTSIPRGIYWAVVTLTTVGYGDVAPVTSLGQALAAVVMIMGYGIIAVPTGIVTAELTAQPRLKVKPTVCTACQHQEVDPAASFCRLCGAELP